MTIRTKDELLVLMEDNATGNITAQTMRDFVESNLSVSVVSATVTPFDVSEMADAVIAGPGASLINLPVVDAYGDRTGSVVVIYKVVEENGKRFFKQMVF